MATDYVRGISVRYLWMVFLVHSVVLIFPKVENIQVNKTLIW